MNERTPLDAPPRPAPAIYPDQVETPWGPARDLKDGRWAYVMLLVGSRGRICIGRAGDLTGYDDGY